MEKEFWFRVDKWHNDKPDFCKVKAVDEKTANYAMEDQLLYGHRNLKCEYFSSQSFYRRNINDIKNYYIVPYTEVKKHMKKIEFAMENVR